MVKNSTAFVGLDLGDESCDLSSLDPEGKLIEEICIPTTEPAFRRKFASLPPCRVAMEAGTHSRWARRLLEQLGHEVLVANPRKLRPIYSSPRKVLRTPFRTLKADAVCERFLGSLRRECLDHLLVVGDRHLHRVIKEYVGYFNPAEPHQGIGHKIPEGIGPQPARPRRGRLFTVPVLNGLHHDYRRAG